VIFRGHRWENHGKYLNITWISGTIEDFNLLSPPKICGRYQIFRHPEIQTIWLVDFMGQSGCLATAVFRICPGPMWHKTHHFNGFRCWCLSRCSQCHAKGISHFSGKKVGSLSFFMFFL
jgi:hypothetical protein